MLDTTESFSDIIKYKRESTTPANAMNWQIALIGMIANGLIDYLGFINRKNNMNTNQIKETAALIFEEYPYITAPDVVLFNRLCKIGHFGELKDLNGSVFINWFKQYFKERFDRLNDYWYNQEQEQLKAQAALPEPELSQEEIDLRIRNLQKKLKNFGRGTKEDVVRVVSASNKIKSIRLRVIAKHTDILSLPDYDKRIDALIEEEIAKEGLLEEYNKLENK